MSRRKDASTRLIKPTLPEIYVDEVLQLVDHWDPDWECNGDVQIFDEGIAQYLLIGPKSHSKFFASLILSKPSLRCTVLPTEPVDVLEEQAGNTLQLIYSGQITSQGAKDIEFLKQVLSKRGYHFDQ
uniref:BTB domain-containing protein n=1 Tax=Panagrellus redivivus TaxID=6233 RepID=A0A7E4V9J8_PANRE